MRQVRISVGEYYHVCNRGNNKQIIFRDDRDRARFIFLLLSCQSELSFSNIARQVSIFTAKGLFNWDAKTITDIVSDRYVELVSFSLMPNHFHAIVYERNENGIARYFQRVLNAYTKYFNIRYQKNGHLFSGPYRVTHINNNDQLLYVSAYVHRNCHELPEWKSQASKYPWSSYQDYVKNNRWGDLLAPKIIMEQFTDGGEYKKWVETSGAKDQVCSTPSVAHRIIKKGEKFGGW